MSYLTAKQLAKKWGITERRIIKLCKENRIDGAIKNGMIWMIPENTIKPSDRRNKISKYINTEKRIMVVNFDNPIFCSLISILEKDGFIIDGLCQKEPLNTYSNINVFRTNFKNITNLENTIKETDKYYEGLIIFDIQKNSSIDNKEFIIEEFAKKMNCESSIVLVNGINQSTDNLEKKMADRLKENIGLRINSITLNSDIGPNVIMNYDEIAEDIEQFLTKFKNTTGINIETDGGAIKFNRNGRTDNLEIGRFYRMITNYFKRLNKDSYMWCASTMMEDEWTEEPLEMNFRVTNLEAANRGANIERIFIFSKSKIKEFKNNKTLKIYMQSNIKTMFVDYDELQEKEPELLEIVGDGWDGIDTNTLIVDLPAGQEKRGYISRNKDEVQKAYNCFQKLKEYAKDLKEILK